nr:hypothetical protein GCM10020093_058950 [Planobispora longispora]
MRWTAGRLLGIGYALALGTIAVVGVGSYLRIGDLVEEHDSIERTYRTLSRIEDVRNTLKDAERNQRSYIVIGRDDHLHRYRQAASAVDEHLTALRQAVGADLFQQASVTRLQRLVRDRLDELSETIRLRGTRDFETAAMTALVDRGTRRMTEAGALLDRLERETEQLLVRQWREGEAGAEARGLVLWGSLLAALTVAAGARWLTRMVTVPIRQVAGAATRVAVGDLTPLPVCPGRWRPC